MESLGWVELISAAVGLLTVVGALRWRTVRTVRALSRLSELDETEAERLLRSVTGEPTQLDPAPRDDDA